MCYKVWGGIFLPVLQSLISAPLQEQGFVRISSGIGFDASLVVTTIGHRGTSMVVMHLHWNPCYNCKCGTGIAVAIVVRHKRSVMFWLLNVTLAVLYQIYCSIVMLHGSLVWSADKWPAVYEITSVMFGLLNGTLNVLYQIPCWMHLHWNPCYYCRCGTGITVAIVVRHETFCYVLTV